MATRLYLPASGSAPLGSLAVDGGWEQTTGLVRRPCYTSKQNTSLANDARTWASASTQDWCWLQYQSPQMSYGYSWTTSDTISMVIRVLEGNSACNDHLAYVVKVVSADGITVRGTVGAFFSTSTEWGTSAATRIHSARTNGASNFTSYPGDRIIIEIGSHGVTPSTSYTQTMRLGDPSGTNDFALTSGLTTDLCPWVELSRLVAFGNALITGQADGCKVNENIQTDNFNSYSSGDLGGKGNWVDALKYMWAIGDGTAGIGDTLNNAAYFNNANFTSDQRAKAKITHPETSYNVSIGVAVRVTANNYYVLYGHAYSGGHIQLGVVVSGTFYSIAEVTGSGLSANDILELRIKGTTLTCYLNGSVITSMGAADAPASGNNGIYTDSRISSGYPGIAGYGVAGGASTLDDFEGAGISSYNQVVGTLTQNYHAFFTGVSIGVSSPVGVLTQKQVQGAIAGSAAGVTTLTLTLKGKGKLLGTLAGVSTPSLTLKGRGLLSGILGGATSQTSSLKGWGYVQSSSQGVSTISSTFHGLANLSSSITGVSLLEAVIQGGYFLIPNIIQGSASGEGVMKGTGHLSYTLVSSTELSAVLLGRFGLQGNVSSLAEVEAYLKGMAHLTGEVDVNSILEAVLLGKGNMTASIIAIALLTGYFTTEATLWGTLRIRHNSQWMKLADVGVIKGFLNGEWDGVKGNVSIYHDGVWRLIEKIE